MTDDKLRLEKLIPTVVLPEGYCGKILLVSVVVGTERLVILRSGDLWHREILRNTEAEILALGLSGARIDELGGAHLRFEADGSILIWGGSDAYGACDHEYAAALLKSVWPERKINFFYGHIPVV
jgi:hypothetical protein